MIQPYTEFMDFYHKCCKVSRSQLAVTLLYLFIHKVQEKSPEVLDVITQRHARNWISNLCFHSRNLKMYVLTKEFHLWLDSKISLCGTTMRLLSCQVSPLFELFCSVLFCISVGFDDLHSVWNCHHMTSLSFDSWRVLDKMWLNFRPQRLFLTNRVVCLLGGQI